MKGVDTNDFLILDVGGYLWCKKVEFALGTDLEVNEYRELAFFPGIARGPMLKSYVYDSEEGASAASVRSLIDGNIFYSYHNGGSTFVLDGVDLTNITILAEYANADNAPAIVKCKYRKGEAILSGVHYEDDKNLLLSTGKDLKILKTIAEKVANLFEKGIFMRPLANTVYLLPPYCISIDELAHVYEECFLLKIVLDIPSLTIKL